MSDSQSSHHDWSGLRPPEHFRYADLAVQVRGEFACFTRPEFTSERVSYPIITPTAARGLLSSVLWKPQIEWVVTKVEVLAPVKWTTMRRNESETPITDHYRKAGFLNVDSVVQQRMTTMLRDVHYRIHANLWVHPDAREQDPAKWRDQFQRRVDRGQSFRTPFLGMREFHADVTRPDETPPINWTDDLGIMLHSISFDENVSKETYDWFAARVDSGVMAIPRAGLAAEAGAS